MSSSGRRKGELSLAMKQEHIVKGLVRQGPSAQGRAAHGASQDHSTHNHLLHVLLSQLLEGKVASRGQPRGREVFSSSGSSQGLNHFPQVELSRIAYRR